MGDLAVFDEHFRTWAYAACADWEYPPPTVDWMEAAHARLPVGLRTEIGRALGAGAIETVDDYRFVLADRSTAEPLGWFEQGPALRQPVPNWKRFVQAAEYARILSLVEDHDLTVGFDDRGMDISVSDHGDLLWHVDVAETFAASYELSRDLDRIGAAGIDHNADDARDEALRTAKLIVELQPAYLSLVGIGGRLDFSLAVHDLHHFDLIPDLVPVGARL